MRSVSSIGLGLSVVFTCLLLFLFAEIYYLLWWKRRFIRREIDGYNTHPSREFLFLFCWRKKNLQQSSINPTNTPQANQTDHYQDFQFHANNKDFLVQPLHEHNMEETHLVIGPPRFLFPIEEETKEDLESEDGKSREGRRCLSDLLKRIETPYITPLSSPLTTPMGSRKSTSSGFNPFDETSSDAEFNRMIKTSPPPTFKFLRDAEAKLQKKMMMVVEEGGGGNDNGQQRQTHMQDGSFITIIVASNNKELDRTNHHYHSPYCPSTSSSSISSTCCSQVLPLTSSPSSLPNQMVNSCKTIK